jgi:hypothetical protein
MTLTKWPLAAALALACAAPAFAAPQAVGYTAPDGVNAVAVTPSLPLPTSPLYGASGVAAVSTTLTAAGVSASFTPAAGRLFHVQLSGAAVAACVLERSLDGSTWVPITVTAAGSTTTMYNWSYADSALSEDVSESQFGVAYRVDCGALLGSFTSGSLAVRFSQ